MGPFKRKLAATFAAAALLLVAVPFAQAAASQPKGEYAPFRHCPLSVITLTDCVYSVSSQGGFNVGGHNLPLYSPLVLQGGYEGSGNKVNFHGAEGAETLVKAPQPLAGVIKAQTPAWWPKFLREWFREGVEKKAHSGVAAYIELAAPASAVKLSTENLLFKEGTALGLPLKIRLENQLLGSYCSVGSNAKPMQLKYTSGPSGSLRGRPGKESFNHSYRLTTMANARLVDGTFTAPGASGCGGLLSGFVNPLVNSIFGLPSSAGQSSAVLEGTLEDAQAEAVRGSKG